MPNISVTSVTRPAGEFGYNTWENDSAEYTGNTGVWAQISVDEELGLVYLPVELPTGRPPPSVGVSTADRIH